MRGVAKGLCLRQFTVSSLIILYRSYALHVYMLVNFGERGEICIVCLPRCFLRRFLLEFKSLQSLSCKVTTCYAAKRDELFQENFFFFFFHFYCPVLGTGGGRKTYRDNHQSLPQPTVDTCLLQ